MFDYQTFQQNQGEKINESRDDNNEGLLLKGKKILGATFGAKGQRRKEGSTTLKDQSKGA